MRKIFIFIAVIIALIAGIVAIRKYSAPKEEPSEKPNTKNYLALVSHIEGIIAKYSKIDQDIELSGTIIPSDETTLMTEVAGRVVSLNLQEGKSVGKGTTLVKLFDDDLQAQLKKIEVQLQIANNTENRLKKLLNVNGVSQQEYDAASLQVSNLKAEIDIIKVNISKTEIKAPYNGVIGLKKISLGQYITPSNIIATIRAVNQLKLDFSIPEKYSSAMKAGRIVEFNVSGSDKLFKATIIANESSIESDTRNLKVRALISGNIADIIPGAFAKVKANLGTDNNVIMIPTSAIIPMARDKKVYISKGGNAQFVTVKTGVRQADKIEILSGVNVGDTIVTTGLMFIKPKSPLKFSKVI
ncbi:MAG: efflux RND transporter periplasmic adaptor subunit [Candidatus Kapabacteria bacterium]|nr:efflux RND transporter periplasmic adaptor subunit [Candidatus Kapabacteria bacterium]